MSSHVSLQNVQICSSHVEEITLCVSVDNSMSGLMKADKVNVTARYVHILGLRNKIPLFPIRLKNSSIPGLHIFHVCIHHSVNIW